MAERAAPHRALLLCQAPGGCLGIHCQSRLLGAAPAPRPSALGSRLSVPVRSGQWPRGVTCPCPGGRWPGQWMGGWPGPCPHVPSLESCLPTELDGERVDAANSTQGVLLGASGSFCAASRGQTSLWEGAPSGRDGARGTRKGGLGALVKMGAADSLPRTAADRLRAAQDRERLPRCTRPPDHRPPGSLRACGDRDLIATLSTSCRGRDGVGRGSAQPQRPRWGRRDGQGLL